MNIGFWKKAEYRLIQFMGVRVVAVSSNSHEQTHIDNEKNFVFSDFGGSVYSFEGGACNNSLPRGRPLKWETFWGSVWSVCCFILSFKTSSSQVFCGLPSVEDP